MNNIAINVENICKKYVIAEQQAYNYKSIRNAVIELLPWNYYKRKTLEYFWALKDISFTVEKGDVLGIIGRNGSGKSTLLKILSQIVEPTKGQATLYGRSASLLEVGTGFHPELTGRENIFLNGVILGMTHQEIQKKIDEIIAFSEIEKFVDTPVKHYSNGMIIRLAFSVSTYLDPEILIIDEVLAVGDINFQKKCLDKIESIQKHAEKTILLVSHDILTVKHLCNKSIWLHEGLLKMQGDTETVATEYVHYLSTALETQKTWENIETAPGNEKVRLLYIGLHSDSEDEKVYADVDFTIEVIFANLKENSQLGIKLQIVTEEGIVVFTTHSFNEEKWSYNPLPKATFKSICHIPKNFLNTSNYVIHLYIFQNRNILIYEHKDIIFFQVKTPLVLEKNKWYGHLEGLIKPELTWKIEKL